MQYLTHFIIASSLALCAFSQSSYAEADMRHSDSGNPPMTMSADFGWDSKYVSEGRNNLENGGIYWAGITAQYEDFNAYSRVGRADTEHYTEWQFGIEYGIQLSEQIEATIGYQRLEFYGDERTNDNELFGFIAYTGMPWLTPSVNYTYATEAGGYFIELSLHSSWALTEAISITPYVTQGLDYQYATEAHDGRNNLQFGVEVEYQISPALSLAGHISHTIAQDDMELEINNPITDLDETFAGVYINWQF